MWICEQFFQSEYQFQQTRVRLFYANKGYQDNQQNNFQTKFDQRSKKRQFYIFRPKTFQNHGEYDDNVVYENETEYEKNEYYTADHDYDQKQSKFDSKITINLISAPVITCKICKIEFSSNNKFHQHIKQNNCNAFFKQFIFISIRKKHFFHKKSSNQSDESAVFHETFIIESIVVSKTKSNFDFRNWRYMKINIMLQSKKSIEQICFDIGCIMSFVDRKFLNKLLFNVTVWKFNTNITIKNIDNVIHSCCQGRWLELNCLTIS